MDENTNMFEIDELIKSTYNKIADWNNDVDNTNKRESLKILCIELIEDIAGASFEYMDIPFSIKTHKGNDRLKEE